MDYNVLDDQVLDLALRQAESDYETDWSVERYKIVARLRYQKNVRRARAESMLSGN